MNTALLPAGSDVRSTLSELMASPSGSETLTTRVSGWVSFTAAVAAAVTTGARSTFATETLVLAEPDSVFAAVNVTA